MDVETVQLKCTLQCRLNVGAYPNEALSFEGLLMLIVPEDGDKVEQDIRRALNSVDVDCLSQYRVRHRDGSLHWIVR